MLKNILKQRYKKGVISLFILIIGLYSFWGVSLAKDWHQTKAYINAEEFKEEYFLLKESLENQHVEDNSEYPVSFTLKETKKNRLTIFYRSENINQLYQISNNPEISFEEYTTGVPYLQNAIKYQGIHSTLFNSLLLLFIAMISGFLIFFIDLKTNFNRYLFSLGVSRKQIFKAKLLRIALPIFSSFAIGSLLYTLILQISIPKPYLNVTLGQMLYSSLSHLSLIALFLSIGILLGTLLGNIVFAPLTVLLGFITLIFIAAPYHGLHGIIKYATNIDLPIFDSLFVTFPGKTGALIISNIIIWLLAGICLFIASKIYPTISLENENDYLLLPKNKLPFFLFLAISMSIYTVLAIDVWGRLLSPYRSDVTLVSATVTSVIWIIISVTTMFSLVYFNIIKQWFQHRLIIK